ncbi:hypothetical protein INR49_015723 [Caranx melampygus]|nr:hypothetical protein INR49_015723 [Caranx melampygus]
MKRLVLVFGAGGGVRKWQMNLVEMAVTTEATVEGLHLLDDAGRKRKGRMGLTTAFSASGVITLSSERDAGNDEESGREREFSARWRDWADGRECPPSLSLCQGLGLMSVLGAEGGGEKDTGDGGEAERERESEDMLRLRLAPDHRRSLHLFSKASSASSGLRRTQILTCSP